MNIFWAILLGSLQGLTEYLPISSSGHLVIAQRLIPGFQQPGVLFDVFLHLGTLLAVVVYFFRKILTLNSKYLLMILVASIPAGVFAFVFREFLEKTYLLGGVFLGIQFLITSIFCYLTDKYKGQRKDVSFREAFFIGAGQALAILPAISRSASTIFVGSFLGMNKKEIANFSFILSIPAILGANAFEFLAHGETLLVEFNNEFKFYLVGFITAFIMGFLSIKITLGFLLKSKFRIFAFYTLFLGLIAIFI